MDNLRYHEAQPENSNNSGYGEFSSVDFVVNAAGRKLVKNSLRLEGDLEVFSDGGTTLIALTDIIGVDSSIGAHAFFESWNITLPASKGLISNQQEYPRYVKSVAAATLCMDDYFDGMLQAELRGGHEQNGRIAVQGQASDNTADDARQDVRKQNFCIKPMFSMNRSQGGNYSFNKNGPVRISTNLSRNSAALFGASGAIAANNYTYNLTNLRMRYMTVPEDGQDDKIIMNSYVSIKNSINGTAANISTLVPSQAVSGVTINFLEQSSDVSSSLNSNALHKYPTLKDVAYSFSDATNQYVSYTLTDLGDIQHKALEGLRSAGYHMVDADHAVIDNGFLAGLDFGNSFIDLSRNKFSVQLTSEDNIGQYFIYLYFHTLLSL